MAQTLLPSLSPSLSLARSAFQQAIYERFCGRVEYFPDLSPNQNKTVFRFAEMEKDKEEDYVNVDSRHSIMT